MTAYRIRDWSKHFENNRTRELKELRFVILPNKHDGDGYTELLDHPNGAAHYAAWVSLVQVTSKGKHPAGGCGISAGCCECRGTLLREGAKPHDPASLSRLTRIPINVFEEALPRLVSIGWLEVETQSNQVDSKVPHPPAEPIQAESRTPLRESAVSIEWNGREGNGTEGKEEAAPPAKRQRRRKDPPSLYTSAPDSLPVTDAMRAWAAEKTPGIDPDLESEKFIDKARSKDWSFADWVSAWHNWMRNAKKYADADAQKNGAGIPARALTAADVKRMKESN